MTSIDTGGAAYPEMFQLMGNLYLKRNQPERAVMNSKRRWNPRNALSVCHITAAMRKCHFRLVGQMSRCRQWNSFQPNFDAVQRVGLRILANMRHPGFEYQNPGFLL